MFAEGFQEIRMKIYIESVTQWFKVDIDSMIQLYGITQES